MYDTLKVIPPGTTVAIGNAPDEPIEGTVISVEINADFHVRYQVVWWEMRNRHEVTLEAFELSVADEAERLPIGFVETP